MTDWIEHNGGPQPVGDDVWVATSQRAGLGEDSALAGALDWRHIERSRDIDRYRILNQHLIDAALKRGIELGLKAAARLADVEAGKAFAEGRLMGQARAVQIGVDIRDLNPDTIAREAVLDQLTSEAQAQDMGYEND